jgi:tetratricopeptide (TPR) repeat protein
MIVAAGLVVTATGQAQVRDVVFYRDRTAKPEKNAEFVGAVVDESVNGVKVKPLVGPERTFTVADIIDVMFDPPTSYRIPFVPIQNGESDLRTGTGDQKAKMALLVKEYTNFLANFRDTKAVGFKREAQYRLAMLRAGLAEKRDDQVEAIEQLKKFRKENSGGWQLIPVVRQETQLLMDVGKLDEAATVLDEASRVSGLSKELKRDLELSLIDMQIRAGKMTEVESRIDSALRSLPADDPLAPKLKVYQIGSQIAKTDIGKLAPELTAIIDKTQDASLKALAYNTLGDCYSAKGLKKDAMWAYLWVDVVYNQDKTEYAKAVERLSRVFKDLNDEPRAEKYREKLKSLR